MRTLLLAVTIALIALFTDIGCARTTHARIEGDYSQTVFGLSGEVQLPPPYPSFSGAIGYVKKNVGGSYDRSAKPE